MLLLTCHTRTVALIVLLVTLMKKIIIYLGETALEREMITLTNDSKDLLNPFDTNTNSVCFSEDTVRANILHNGRILDKNVKVTFEEQTGSFYDIA